MDTIFYFLNDGFWKNSGLIALFCISIFAVVLIRYIVVAVSFRAAAAFIFGVSSLRVAKKIQIKREVWWSVCSSMIFAVLSVTTYYLFSKGFTQVYSNLSQRSVVYFFLSIVIYLTLYETYYYWLHRWMHRPGVFKIVHRVHHESLHPTVFTSFSFHPLEAVLQFLFLPIALMLIPIHHYALGIVLLIWTISAVVNHSGVEIFSEKFTRHPIGKWFIGSTHHDLHHKEFRTNFGLYFTFWDKYMDTENDSFPTQFRKNKEILIQSRSQRHRSAGAQRR